VGTGKSGRHTCFALFYGFAIISGSTAVGGVSSLVLYSLCEKYLPSIVVTADHHFSHSRRLLSHVNFLIILLVGHDI
jgi:hypothetical protein